MHTTRLGHKSSQWSQEVECVTARIIGLTLLSLDEDASTGIKAATTSDLSAANIASTRKDPLTQREAASRETASHFSVAHIACGRTGIYPTTGQPPSSSHCCNSALATKPTIDEVHLLQLEQKSQIST